MSNGALQAEIVETNPATILPVDATSKRGAEPPRRTENKSSG
jgi:hypothetical protein